MDDNPKNAQQSFIPYRVAMHKLQDRLGATREDLAAWIFLGPELGGLNAYLNANELGSESPFRFEPHMGNDYLAALMGTWFSAEEINTFDSKDRFITGGALRIRWSADPTIDASDYIIVKIGESSLSYFHPTIGVSEWSQNDTTKIDGATASLEGALFLWSDVYEIEQDEHLVLPAASIGRRDLTSRHIKEKHIRWVDCVRDLRSRHPSKSVRWIAEEISKLPIAEGNKAGTIRRIISKNWGKNK